MTLYEKLSKENQSRISTVSRKELLEGTSFVASLTITESASMFWDIYPEKPFDLTLFYNLFE